MIKEMFELLNVLRDGADMLDEEHLAAALVALPLIVCVLIALFVYTWCFLYSTKRLVPKFKDTIAYMKRGDYKW